MMKILDKILSKLGYVPKGSFSYDTEYIAEDQELKLIFNKKTGLLCVNYEDNTIMISLGLLDYQQSKEEFDKTFFTIERLSELEIEELEEILIDCSNHEEFERCSLITQVINSKK